MIYLKDYLDYFENLCINHPELNHDPADEESQVFQPITIEESFGNFTMNVVEKGFIVRPIIYTKSTSVNEGGDAFMNKQGGLIIGHYFDKNDYSSRVEAMDKSERLIDEFIQRMTYDSIEGEPLWNYSLNHAEDISVQNLPLLGDNSYTGWRMIFNFSNDVIEECLDNVDGVVWKDIADPPPMTQQIEIFNFSGELMGTLSVIVDN